MRQTACRRQLTTYGRQRAADNSICPGRHAANNMKTPTDNTYRTSWSGQHAGGRIQQETSRGRRVADNMQLQPAPCADRMQRAACSRQRATDNMQRAEERADKVQQTTGIRRRAADKVKHPQASRMNRVCLPLLSPWQQPCSDCFRFGPLVA